jgi:FMN-binding domain
MRTYTAAALSALTLALPVTNAVAAATASTVKPKIVVTTRRFLGTSVETDRWGPLQVSITVRKTKTTVGKKVTVKRRIVSISVPVYPNHTDRSIFINQRALPYLKQEALQAQSANVQLISGATDTSYSFVQSLQAAILQARKA